MVSNEKPALIQIVVPCRSGGVFSDAALKNLSFPNFELMDYDVSGHGFQFILFGVCLLYTSDAADDWLVV